MFCCFITEIIVTYSVYVSTIISNDLSFFSIQNRELKCQNEHFAGSKFCVFHADSTGTYDGAYVSTHHRQDHRQKRSMTLFLRAWEKLLKATLGFR